jgi:hypothetical protein
MAEMDAHALPPEPDRQERGLQTASMFHGSTLQHVQALSTATVWSLRVESLLVFGVWIFGVSLVLGAFL